MPGKELLDPRIPDPQTEAPGRVGDYARVLGSRLPGVWLWIWCVSVVFALGGVLLHPRAIPGPTFMNLDLVLGRLGFFFLLQVGIQTSVQAWMVWTHQPLPLEADTADDGDGLRRIARDPIGPLEAWIEPAPSPGCRRPRAALSRG